MNSAGLVTVGVCFLPSSVHEVPEARHRVTKHLPCGGTRSRAASRHYVLTGHSEAGGSPHGTDENVRVHEGGTAGFWEAPGWK